MRRGTPNCQNIKQSELQDSLLLFRNAAVTFWPFKRSSRARLVEHATQHGWAGSGWAIPPYDEFQEVRVQEDQE
jgi:hypothetical protein